MLHQIKIESKIIRFSKNKKIITIIKISKLTIINK
jgi:hypothetical protein